MSPGEHEVLVTGIGLISSLGDGWQAHARLLAGGQCRPVADAARFAPYVVHPLGDVDFSGQIPKRSDRNQMERWQLIGVHAAGLALADAGLAGRTDLLNRMDICVAAGNGERDTAADTAILAALSQHPDREAALAAVLPRTLRPTLYLAQLSNLLAGSISIIHKATGSSRTFKGEEMAGVAAFENAVQRIENGEGNVFLVGAALNAEREDLLLNYELEGSLWHGGYRSIGARAGRGMCLGSMGAFLVLERRAHAEARAARPYARIVGVRSSRRDRSSNPATAAIGHPLDGLGERVDGEALLLMSGASGVGPALDDERDLLHDLVALGNRPVVRTYGSMLGHGMEAHFPAGMALGAVAIAEGLRLPPFDDARGEGAATHDPTRVIVTAFGHERGEGFGLLEAVQ